jgi:hypothetical protein
MYHDRFREVLRREVSPRRALKRAEASTSRSRLVLRVLKRDRITELNRMVLDSDGSKPERRELLTGIYQ